MWWHTKVVVYYLSFAVWFVLCCASVGKHVCRWYSFRLMWRLCFPLANNNHVVRFMFPIVLFEFPFCTIYYSSCLVVFIPSCLIVCFVSFFCWYRTTDNLQVCCLFLLYVCRIVVLCCVSVEQLLSVDVFPSWWSDVCIFNLQTITPSFVSLFFLQYCLKVYFAQLRFRSIWLFVVLGLAFCVCRVLSFCLISHVVRIIISVVLLKLWFCTVTGS